MIFDLLDNRCINILKSDNIFEGRIKSSINLLYCILKRINLILKISFCIFKSCLKSRNRICEFILSCAFAESNLKCCCQLLYCSKTSGVIFDLLDNRCINVLESNDVFKSRIKSSVNLCYLIIKGINLILEISFCAFKSSFKTRNCFCKLILSCTFAKSNLKCCCQLLYCSKTSGVIFDLLDNRCINILKSDNIFEGRIKSSIDFFYLILKRVNLILEIIFCI